MASYLKRSIRMRLQAVGGGLYAAIFSRKVANLSNIRAGLASILVERLR